MTKSEWQDVARAWADGEIILFDYASWGGSMKTAEWTSHETEVYRAY